MLLPFLVEKIEIDLTASCNLSCCNCSRLCNLIRGTSEDNISVQKIEKFLRDSIQLNWPWKELRITGGEPTIHPDFETIVHLLSEYKKNYNEQVSIMVFSNGICREKLASLDKTVSVFISPRERSPCFVTIAPVDLNIYDPAKNPCGVMPYCGICLAASGFYPCGQGAAVARIFNIDCAIDELAEITASKLIEIANYKLCQFCGSFFSCALINSQIRVRDFQPISQTWEKQLSLYKSKHGGE